MITKKFYLKPGNTNKNGEKPIVMAIGIGKGRPFIIHVQKTIKPTQWSKAQQKPNNKCDAEYAKEVLLILKAFSEKLDEITTDAFNKNITLTPEYIKLKLKGEFTKNRPEFVGFFDAFEEYIEVNKSVRANNTIKGYITTKNFLIDFKKKKKIPMDFQLIDINFFEDFRTYCYADKKININYFAKLINVLKSFMKWAEQKSYHHTTDYQNFHAAEASKDVIFLKIDELLMLKDYVFESKKHARARDLYCFGCFTGLRISDVNNLTWNNIKEDNIQLTIKKTKKSSIIPLNKFSKEIIERYSGEQAPLPKLSNQKVNDYIKEACKIAGINEIIEITTYIGGNPSTKPHPKYELITFHTARKTFVTNSLVLGMNVKTIMEITGHKKDSVFNKYLNIAEEFKKQQMDDTWGKV